MNGAGIVRSERALQVVTGGVVLFVSVALLLGVGPAAGADGTGAMEKTTTITQEEPWIHINASDAQGQQGDVIAVDIRVEELLEDREEESALGYNLLLNYDRDVLEFVEAESVAFDNVSVYQDPPIGTKYETEPENSGEYGVVRLADMEQDTEATPPFTAVRVRFKLVGDPGDQTQVELPLESEEGEELGGVARIPTSGWPATSGSGTVTILEEQTPSGTVSGTVTDEDGNPIEGASVRVGGTEATTDADGSYELEVQEGSYELKIGADGYQDVTNDIEVTGDETATADATLTETEDETSSSQLALVGQVVGLGGLVAGGLLMIVGLIVRARSVLA